MTFGRNIEPGLMVKSLRMPEGQQSGWIARIRRSLPSWRGGRGTLIVNELDEKPAFSFWLHLRAFASLVREILSR